MTNTAVMDFTARPIRKGDTVQIDYPGLTWAHGKQVVAQKVHVEKDPLTFERMFDFDLTINGRTVAHSLPIKCARRVLAPSRKKATKWQ